MKKSLQGNCIHYRFEPDEIPVTMELVGDILYQGAPGEVIREKMHSPGNQKILKTVQERYTPLLNLRGWVRPVPTGLLRELFAESLADDSPIYGAVDDWVETALFIATIGPAPEDSIPGLQKTGRITQALFLDAFLSVSTDQLAEIIMKDWAGGRIPEASADGHRFCPQRYSPGYCRWDVSGQTALFGYMADLDIPVSLTSGNMMHPRKSISGILVVEKFAPGDVLTASCRRCGDHCPNIRRITCDRK